MFFRFYLLHNGCLFFVSHRNRLRFLGCANVVGKSDHGHACVASSGHRIAHRRTSRATALRSNEAADIQDNVQEHYRPCHLSVDHPPCYRLRWYEMESVLRFLKEN